MFPCSKPNIENKAQSGLDEVLERPGQLLTHDGFDLAALPPGADGQVLAADSTSPLGIAWRDSGAPNFPGSSTDNAVVRFDGTSGSVVQNSAVTIDDDGNVYLPGGKAIQWGSDVKLRHAGGESLVLGSAFNGDPVNTEFTAGKIWTNEIYTPSIESNVTLDVRAGGIGMWLSSNLIVDRDLSVKQDAEVEGELRANIGTITTLSATNATIANLDISAISPDTINTNTINTDILNADTATISTVGASSLTATNATFTNPISAPNFPSAATDNAVVRFDGAGGNVVQNSAVTIDDDGNVYLPAGKTVQWGSDIKLYHDGGQDLVLGYANNGDPAITSFTAGKIMTNEIFTPSIESNTHITVKAGGAGLWLSSGNLTVNDNLSVKQDAGVDGNVAVGGDLEVAGELSADTIKPASDSKVTVSSDADVLGNLGVAGNIEVTGKATLSSTLDVDDNAQFTRDVTVSGTLTAADASFTNPINAPNFPAAATDKAVVRFNGTSGNVVQDSAVTIADDGTITTPSGISARNLTLTHTSATQTAFGVGVNGDPFPRGRFAVRADGIVSWGNGAVMDVQLRRSAAQTLTLSGVTGPSATLALDYGSSIIWSGSPNSSNTINLNGGQVYAGTLNIAPNGSLAWKNTGSGNGGALVNTADGQWELRDSSGSTSTTSLKVGQVNGLPVTNWIIDDEVVDEDGVMGGVPFRIRVAKLTNKIWYFEIGSATFTATKTGTVYYHLSNINANFIRSAITSMWFGDGSGIVEYNRNTKYLEVKPFFVGGTYNWAGTSFILSEE